MILEIGRLCQEITLILNKPLGSDATVAQSLKKAGYALWDCLFTRSTKEKLKKSLGSSLLLEIDEELVFIPWEFLFDGEEFLSLSFNLGRLVKTKSTPPFLNYRSLSATYKMLVLVNPTGDLKGAYLEGMNIKNQFDRKRKNIRIDFKSTDIDKLYVKKSICDYDIIHFAGHCEYDCRFPNNSGWVLKDGNFSIQDILKLGSGLSLPALIFSNACNSAKQASYSDRLGADYQKKNYSLASAFLFAGVRHYIGSVMKIEDKASVVFAKEFYHNLISGKSIGLALRLSRIKLVKEYGISSVQWGNYLLYGDPSFVMFRPKVIKHKKKLILPKKRIIQVASLAVFILSIVFLSLFLPTLNPNAYFLFLRAQGYYAQGANQKHLILRRRLLIKIGIFLRPTRF